MNGLQELPLVLADPGVVHLPHQLGVLVDQPRLPENIRRRVFHLRRTNHKRPFQPPSDPKLLKGTVCIKCYYKYIINIHTQESDDKLRLHYLAYEILVTWVNYIVNSLICFTLC